MTTVVIIDEAGTRREVEEPELPVVIGGPAADIELPGVAAQAAAFIGLEGEAPFIQPVRGGERVLCNGDWLTTSQWMRSGDEIRIRSATLLVEQSQGEVRIQVQSQSGDVDTEPPLIVPSPSRVEQDSPPTRVVPASYKPQPIRRSRRLLPNLHPWAVATWVLLAAFGVVAWFLFSARAVEVRVEPQPDRVEIVDGGLAFRIGGRWLLRPGRYAVRAEKEGYRHLKEPLVVSKSPNQVHEFEMRKLPGLLNLVTVPATGASVRIDGEDFGITPLAPIELEPGSHTVAVAAGRFEPVESSVEIAGGGATTFLTVELTPLWAPVSVESRPAGALVRIDGKEVGRTPLTTELFAGQHDLELRLQGYEVYRQSLTVLANQPYVAPLAVLVPADGQLILTSDPSGATVAVDGEFRGQTPLEIDLEPGVDHRVGLSRSGHEATETTIRLESGESRELYLSLDPRFGEIEIRSQPAGAELLIDGESRGEANQTLRLTAVPHDIEVRKEGHEPFSQRLTPRPGFPQVVEVSLRTEEQVREAAILPTIQGPQGQELRLLETGGFRMGASRREPGRRANETFRDVELTRRFYLGSREVTNREFREFNPEHRSGNVGQKTLDLDEYPVVNVTWNEAARYCNWLSQREGLPAAYRLVDGTMVAVEPLNTGYRLPTEAEWAWAARFAGGSGGRKYPWGDSLPVPANAGNYADSSAAGLVEPTLDGFNDGYATTAPVDSFEPNAVGIFHLGGNVAEWVHDFYNIRPDDPGTVERDPSGPGEGAHHVIRGASWMDSTITELRLSYRDYGNQARPDVGFRVARYAE